MDGDAKFGRITLSTRASGSTIKLAGRESYYTLTATYMKAHGLTIRPTERASTSIATVRPTTATGEMINNTV